MSQRSVLAVCLLWVAGCGSQEAATPVPVSPAIPAASQLPAENVPPPAPTPTIYSQVEGVAEVDRVPLMVDAIKKVSEENRAGWMLEASEGSSFLIGQIEAIHAKARPNETFHSLVKEALQATKEEFLNRAEVAKTTSEMLYRAKVEAERQRQINAYLRQQRLAVERQAAAEHAALMAAVREQEELDAAYVRAVNQQKDYQQRAYTQRSSQLPAPRRAPANSSRFDPENVGWDPRRGYTAPSYASSARESEPPPRPVNTEPRRYQDQHGNWYEQPHGSNFARDVKTGKQCVQNGAFLHCK